MAVRNEPAEEASRSQWGEEERQIRMSATRNGCVDAFAIKRATRKYRVQRRRQRGLAFGIDSIDRDSIAYVGDAASRRIQRGACAPYPENGVAYASFDEALERRSRNRQAIAQLSAPGEPGTRELSEELCLEFCPVIGHNFKSIFDPIKLSKISIVLHLLDIF
jgi:hypothetical protein